MVVSLPLLVKGAMGGRWVCEAGSEALSKALVLGASGSCTRSTHFCWAVTAESELEGYMLERPVQGLETDQALLPLSHGVEPLSAGRWQTFPVSPSHSRTKRTRAPLGEQGRHTDSTESRAWTPGKFSVPRLPAWPWAAWRPTLGVLWMGTVLLTYPGTAPFLR